MEISGMDVGSNEGIDFSFDSITGSGTGGAAYLISGTVLD